jgi:hypothetical protein
MARPADRAEILQVAATAGLGLEETLCVNQVGHFRW